MMIFVDNYDNSRAHCCDQDGYRPDGSKVIYDYKQASQSLTTCHYGDHMVIIWNWSYDIES